MEKKPTESFHSIVRGQLNIHEVDEALNASYYLDNLWQLILMNTARGVRAIFHNMKGLIECQK